MLTSQHNAWIHAAATVVVVGAGLAWWLTATEWCAVVLAVMAVWMAEALNTALECLADATSPAFHPLIGKAKDVAAGAVLLAAVGAVVVGLLIFGPRARQLGHDAVDSADKPTWSKIIPAREGCCVRTEAAGRRGEVQRSTFCRGGPGLPGLRWRRSRTRLRPMLATPHTTLVVV